MTISRRHVAVGVGAILVAALVWYGAVKSRPTPTRLTPTEFVAEAPARVAPGESFTITVTYFNVVRLGEHGKVFSILNRKGENILRTPEDLVPAAASLQPFKQMTEADRPILRELKQAIGTASGVMYRETYKAIQTEGETGWFQVLRVGCGARYVGKGDTPAKVFTDREEFVVLPGTPRGEYTVHVSGDDFGCAVTGTPSQDLILNIST